MRVGLTLAAAAAFAFPAGALAGLREQSPGDTIGAQACSALQEKLGAEKFAAKFGSPDGCKAQLASRAAAIASECRSSGQPGTAPFKECVQAAMKSLIQTILQESSGKTSDEQGAKIAAQVCANLKEKMGAEKFTAKFGSAADCQAKFASQAGGIGTKCKAAGKPGSPEFKACVQEAVKPLVQAQLAEDKQSAATAKLAASMCATLKEKLGDKFDAKYGTAEECAQKLNGAASSITAKCKSAGKPGGDEYKACVKQGVQDALKKQLSSGKKDKP